MNKLWHIGGEKSDDFVDTFTVGDDYLLDQVLLSYDVQASKVHAKMLLKMGTINKKEHEDLQKGLDEILALHKKGEFKILPEQEDCHTAIEQYLTEKCPEAGKKIHTFRSRNDQVLTALRLYMKHEFAQIQKLVMNLIKSLQKKAKKSEKIPMPGYTHYQKAMPTDCGTWFLSFADALEDNLSFLQSLKKTINQNPLGSGAGFGFQNFKIDRELTAKEMGFAKVQKNPLYCGFSRGYFEYLFLNNLAQIVIVFSRFASDLLLFSTQEFDFVKLPNSFVTGSSIMPQKKNPDTIEILQGKISSFLAKKQEIEGIILKLSSGYHREYQLIKKPFFEGIKIIKDCIQIVQIAVEELEFKENNLQQAMSDDLFATEKVYELVKKGMSFRDAYKKVKKELGF